jgi:DNA-binding beta-propeller fold protein YncE
VSYDANNSRLFVADYNNDRVMVYNVAPSVLATGENASYVIGASNFTSSIGDNPITQSGFGPDSRVLYDPATTLLYVQDEQASRILIFDGTMMPQGLPGYE